MAAGGGSRKRRAATAAAAWGSCNDVAGPLGVASSSRIARRAGLQVVRVALEAGRSAPRWARAPACMSAGAESSDRLQGGDVLSNLRKGCRFEGQHKSATVDVNRDERNRTAAAEALIRRTHIAQEYRWFKALTCEQRNSAALLTRLCRPLWHFPHAVHKGLTTISSRS